MYGLAFSKGIDQERGTKGFLKHHMCGGTLKRPLSTSGENMAPPVTSPRTGRHSKMDKKQCIKEAAKRHNKGAAGMSGNLRYSSHLV